MKVYLKKGKRNYKENRLISEIEKAILKNPQTNVTPAYTMEELQSLHDKLCTIDSEFEDVTSTIKDNSEIDAKHKEFRKGMEETVVKESNAKPSTTSSFLDPFNDAEPIVRDYVLNEGFEKESTQPKIEKTTFDEPTNFEDSFDLPSPEEEKSNAKSSPKDKKEKKSDAPVNPKFDEMDNGKKKRSTKKLAKMIVEGACILAEKGCIWWTTKDITEDKLVQYELENTMDLQILLTLEEGQQITVREWFVNKVAEADQLYKVSKEDKDDLIDSLYEVLLEKGIAPTPMQELIINAVKTFVLDMGLKAFAMQQQIKSVLTQLTLMKGQPQQATQQMKSVTNVKDNDSYEDLDYVYENMDLDSPVVDNTPQIINTLEEVSETELQ